ncbi:hypothetical protein [Salinirussus salinus]|uniref:hypothetical protein n=1 Tax=Salinirussus salinus TaxID=1198300 RepID=UPI0013576A9A|nr:hypothetical protein [Salinirussus salinus]
MEADRTVSIGVESDSSALLGLSVDGSYAGLANGNSGGNTVQLNVTQLNDNAVTRFNNGFTITNNGSNPVDVSVSNVPNALSFEYSDGSGGTTALSSSSVNLTASGDSQAFDVVVDLRNNSVPSDKDITISANSS